MDAAIAAGQQSAPEKQQRTAGKPTQTPTLAPCWGWGTRWGIVKNGDREVGARGDHFCDHLTQTMAIAVAGGR